MASTKHPSHPPAVAYEKVETYSNPPPSNPTLSGLPLAVLSSVSVPTPLATCPYAAQCTAC